MKTSICPKCNNEKDPRATLCLGCSKPLSLTKKCNGCGLILTRDSFGIRGDGKNGFRRRSKCRKCEAMATALWRSKMSKEEKDDKYKKKIAYNILNVKKNRFQSRVRNVKKWGGNQSKISAYINDHDNTCDICGKPESIVGTLHIDHCHKTNQFRGLLCSNCNTGLGQFSDDIERMLMAIEYLKRPLPDLNLVQLPTRQNKKIEEREGVLQKNLIRGEMASWSKLKTEQVKEIKNELKNGTKISIIAKMYGVSRMAIYAIRNGTNWSHIEDDKSQA